MDLATPYLDRFAKRIGAALSALNRRAGRALFGLGKFLSVNERDATLYLGLALTGAGLALRFGVWLGLLIPGAIIVFIAIFGVAPVKPSK